MNLPLFTKAKIIKNAKNFANFRKVKNHAYRRILGFSLHETLKHAPILPLHLKNAGKSSKNKFKNLTENAKNLILSIFFRPQNFFPNKYFLWVCMSSFGGCMWDVNDVTVWPGSSTSPPSDPRRETVWYGLASKKLAAKKLAANNLLRVFRRSDFIYTKNSAIGRSDFIYTKNSARRRYDFIYTKSFTRKIAKH